MDNMTDYNIKSRVYSETLSCYRQGLFAGTSGNLSEYDPKTGYIYITPSSFSYEKMQPEDIMVINTDGEIIDGCHRPSSEWRMHAVIYKNKPEVRAVVHTHSPYAASFAVNRSPIPVILIEMVPFLGGDVKVADFAVPGTDAVGENCIEPLSDRYACLMANHGAVAVGACLEEAHIRATYVEDAAKILSIAMSNGLPVTALGDDEIAAMRGR